MSKDSISKYQHLTPNTGFSVSRAIMSMIEDNMEINRFTKGDFELAVNFATSAWNLAIINDDMIISLLVKTIAKELKKEVKKSQKQVEAMLIALVKLKNKLYGNAYRIIGDYDASFKDGEPYLKIASGQDMPSDYFANHYRKTLFGNQKYGWVKNEDL
ncbi:MAG: hypothetical protein E6Q89_06765 [Bacteroidia bacterium]|nr:MAG: hypothetical protein E6Q89_06765 [Bacteroidia bacterium]